MTIIKVSRDGKAIVKKKEDETVVPLVRISFLLQRRWPIIYVAIVFQVLLTGTCSNISFIHHFSYYV